MQRVKQSDKISPKNPVVLNDANTTNVCTLQKNKEKKLREKYGNNGKSC